MPCLSPESDQSRHDELIQKLDFLTNSLCLSLSLLKTTNLYSNIPDNIKKWHEQHIKEDEDRKRKEKADEKILRDKKKAPDERKLLGLR